MLELYPVDEASTGKAHIRGLKQYEAMYKASLEQPDEFWSQQAESLLHWHKKWTLPVCS